RALPQRRAPRTPARRGEIPPRALLREGALLCAGSLSHDRAGPTPTRRGSASAPRLRLDGGGRLYGPDRPLLRRIHAVLPSLPARAGRLPPADDRRGHRPRGRLDPPPPGAAAAGGRDLPCDGGAGCARPPG